VQSISVAGTDIPPKNADTENAATQTNQQQGMQDNLEGSIPDSDLNEEQALENPRIVVPENLQEMSDVKTVSSKGGSSEAQSDDESKSPLLQKTEEELKQFEDEMQMESADRSKVLLDKTDEIMELSHRPLTYIQENVPFLTKRNIIFFGRLELDGSYYSSGILEDDSGFEIRRFRWSGRRSADLAWLELQAGS